MSKLQDKLIPLAEKAGMETDGEFFWVPQVGVHDPRYKEPGLVPDMLPGADGTLSPEECWTVLGWLAKASWHAATDSYENSGSFVDGKWERVAPPIFQGYAIELEQLDTGETIHSGKHDTLTKALVAAVLELPL